MRHRNGSCMRSGCRRTRGSTSARVSWNADAARSASSRSLVAKPSSPSRYRREARSSASLIVCPAAASDSESESWKYHRASDSSRRNACLVSESARRIRVRSAGARSRSAIWRNAATVMHWPPPPSSTKRTPSRPPPLSPSRFHLGGGGENEMGWAHQRKVSCGPSVTSAAGFPPQAPMSAAIRSRTGKRNRAKVGLLVVGRVAARSPRGLSTARTPGLTSVSDGPGSNPGHFRLQKPARPADDRRDREAPMPHRPICLVVLFGLALTLAVLCCGEDTGTSPGPTVRELDSPPLLGATTDSQNSLHAFANAGTYPYHCEFHTSAHHRMAGTVIVDAAGPESVFVSISLGAYHPDIATVRPGGQVRWQNFDDGTHHTVTSD